VAIIAREKRWSAGDARLVLEVAERSGVSLRRFAAQHGIDPQRLYWWRRRALGAAASPSASLQFQEIVVKPATPAVLDVVLRSGHVIRVGANFDADLLRRLVGVLEMPPA
jgi:transposase-like protein